jgi:hypothetical protein
MNKSYLWSVVCAFLVFVHSSVNAEPYVYAYTGNNFDTFLNTLIFDSSMSISGHFEIASPLDPNLNMASINPVSYSFTNGVVTLTETTSTISSSGLLVSTDATGAIIDWSFLMYEGDPDALVIGDKMHTISSDSNSDVARYSELLGISVDSGVRFFGIIAEARTTILPGTWEIFNIRPIDITSNNNSDHAIKLMQEKYIKVAILGDETFDALQVDFGTVKFGSTGVEASPIRSKVDDYNDDGFSDVMLTFNVADTGISCEDTEAVLTGNTYTEPTVTIKGTDNLPTVCQ